jgi:hypothetical protein
MEKWERQSVLTWYLGDPMEKWEHQSVLSRYPRILYLIGTGNLRESGSMNLYKLTRYWGILWESWYVNMN